MTMPTWPARFYGVPTAVKSAPLLGEHTAEVLALARSRRCGRRGLTSGRHHLRRLRPARRIFDARTFGR
ncbi:MAG: hypothetical protein WA709_08420 [Stellaceae bacterium]